MRWSYSGLLTILTILIFSSPVPAQQSNVSSYRLVVQVLSRDRNEPIEGATIKIAARFDPKFSGLGASESGGHERRETTMEDGRAYVAFHAPGEFAVTASHPDFNDGLRVTTVIGGTPFGDVPVTIQLTRKKELKVVEVTVVEEGTKRPLYDASVVLHGGGSRYYSARTDSRGIAVLNVIEGADYNVQIKHRQYAPITTSLKVKGHDDEQKAYKLGVEMSLLKDDALRTVRVVVQEQTEHGKRPAMAAGVHVPDGQIKITGRDGSVDIKHRFPPGEEVRLEVEKNGFKTASATFGVGVMGAAKGPEGGGIDTVSVTLEPEAAGSFTGVWKTGWGDLTLKQTGNSVEGSYAHDSGKIRGTVSGNEMTGKWSEAPSHSEPHDGGDVVFTLTSPNNLEGKWKYGSAGEWKTDWSGTRQQ